MKKKIRFYKALLIEIIETLCTICLYLESDGRYSHIEGTEEYKGLGEAKQMICDAPTIIEAESEDK